MKLQIGQLDTGDPAITLLTSMFRACVEAAMPINCLNGILPNPAPGRTVVVGAGKAAHEMARAVEENWPDPGRISGAVTVPQGKQMGTQIGTQMASRGSSDLGTGWPIANCPTIYHPPKFYPKSGGDYARYGSSRSTAPRVVG